MKPLHIVGGGLGLLGVSVAGLALYGSTQPRDHVASITVQLDRTPTEVFAIIEDVASYPCWRTGVSRVDVVSDDPLRFVEYVDGDGVTYEVADHVEGRKLVSRIADEDLPYGGTWTYELPDRNGGTDLTITERGFVDGLVMRGVAALLMDPRASIAQYQTDLQSFQSCN